jgi:hypothetical protein
VHPSATFAVSVLAAALASSITSIHAAPNAETAAIEDKDGIEVGVLPLIGGDTDHGFGGGAIGSVASFEGTAVPFQWQLQFSGFVAFKDSADPAFVDAFATLIAPQLLAGRLRLEVRPSFTRESRLRYFGQGNAITIPDDTDEDRDTFGRLHPKLQIKSRWRLTPHSRWSAIAAMHYLFNKVSFAADSRVATEVGTTDPHIDDIHHVLRVEGGVAYDSRDNEIAPSRGMFHSLTARFSPRMGNAFPYRYEQVDLQLRFFVALSPRNVLAVRAVGDAILGDAPFYELARYEDASAIGGALAVRGVPGFTFYGRVKAFGNVELRTHIKRFTLWDRRFRFGVATFVDAGRSWMSLTDRRTDLDGTGLGLHAGLGGGIRLQQGRAFVIRADVAWSPDADPIAGYLLANHTF